MEAIRSVLDFKNYLNKNRDRIYKNAVELKDIPKDDEWAQDNAWDVVYKREVEQCGRE